jgi:hypothetical protein
MNDKMLTELSPEQEALIPVVRDRWFNLAVGGDTSLDVDALRVAFDWLYKEANLPAAERMEIFDSPLAMVKWAREHGATETTTNGFGIGYDGSWVSFYDYFREIGMLKDERFDKYVAFLKTGVWDSMVYENAVLACRRPKLVSLDEQGRLHSQTGAAVEFEDGYGIYVWHGTAVEKEWITETDKVDVSLALTHPNAESRRCLTEIIGWTKILKSLKVKTIDVNEDPEIGTLVEADLPDVPGQRFLVVKCGTGREFALPVDPQLTTALQANAWTYEMDTSMFGKGPEVRT